MKDTIKDHLADMSSGEKIYTGTVVPMFISFVIYMMIGIPVLAP
jgi:hypothetical protein